MARFFICDNPKCRFLMDRRVNGRTLNGTQFIVKKCPVCGGNWSTTCPSCGQPLAVKIAGGLPYAMCCERKPITRASAA
ncbi:MAG TPA: hypothetical protein VJN42_02465 [Candidatus Acidoferrum sp.]|nr:hypothetical protein [Candidatus Acidoferrum sp.]